MTGLDASVLIFSTFRRCSRRRSANLLPVSPMYIFAIGLGFLGDACEMVSDFNGSIGS